MDRGAQCNTAHGTTKSWTCLSERAHTAHISHTIDLASVESAGSLKKKKRLGEHTCVYVYLLSICLYSVVHKLC